MNKVIEKIEDLSEFTIEGCVRRIDGTKKSNKGVVAVVDDGKGGIMCIDQLPFDNDAPDLMRTIFLNGKLLIDESLTAVRSRCLSSI